MTLAEIKVAWAADVALALPQAAIAASRLEKALERSLPIVVKVGQA
jgi:hypothetical protein